MNDRPLTPPSPASIGGFIAAASEQGASHPFEFVRKVLQWRYIRLSMDNTPSMALQNLCEAIGIEHSAATELRALLEETPSKNPTWMFSIVVQIPAPNDVPDSRCVEQNLPKGKKWTTKDWEDALSKCAQERARD
jgi:hypothetical protein